MWGGLGAKLRLGISGSPAIELFGESPSRIVISCRPRHAAALELLARQFGLDSRNLGTVGGDRLRIELAGQGATGAAEERGARIADALDVAIADLRHSWDHGLARALGVEHGPEYGSEHGSAEDGTTDKSGGTMSGGVN
jgi:phosphoribosylformylglycinamidine synthase